jgi:hypothetical protein
MSSFGVIKSIDVSVPVPCAIFAVEDCGNGFAEDDERNKAILVLGKYKEAAVPDYLNGSAKSHICGTTPLTLHNNWVAILGGYEMQSVDRREEGEQRLGKPPGDTRKDPCPPPSICRFPGRTTPSPKDIMLTHGIPRQQDDEQRALERAC